jgi:hypothetical protein
MKLFEIILLIILAVLVLVCYFIFLKSKEKTSYFTSPFWFGIPKNIVKFLTILQILAAIGFLVAIISWIKNPPQGGIMEKYLFPNLLLFFISAIIWPIAVNKNIVWLTVLSLVLTAISSILLLAGSIEENKPRLHIVVSLIFLCIVTVLGDAVIWNANYIKKKIIK